MHSNSIASMAPHTINHSQHAGGAHGLTELDHTKPYKGAARRIHS